MIIKNILILNGPNFSHLHLREIDFYNGISLADLEKYILSYNEKKFSNFFNIIFYQSNTEGQIIDFLLNNLDKYDALIINPAAYSHYSLSIADTLKILKNNKKLVCEVHLSNVFAREEDRQRLLTAKNADIVIIGASIYSYILALEYISEKSSI